MAPKLTPGPKFERLEVDKAVLLVVDEQVGLYNMVRDFDSAVFYNNMLAHSAIGKLYDIPVIMTTSAETGPNGPLPKEIREMHPKAITIPRSGEVNAWDDPDFRSALESTGRTQVILAGILTDVCTTFLALSLREAGYGVWANVEASGTTTELVREASNLRMALAGVQLVSWFAIVSDLMRDWRNPPGTKGLLPVIERYFPVYGVVAKGHGAAVVGGKLVEGEEEML